MYLLTPSFVPWLSWLDGGVAREAARGWGMVVKEAPTYLSYFGSFMWLPVSPGCSSTLEDPWAPTLAVNWRAVSTEGN